MSNRAWVTLATNDSYGLGALVLAHSLRRANSAYPAVVLVTPTVTEAMRNRLSAVFAEVITVDVLDSRDAAHLALLQRPELGITFTKIHCWALTQYQKCVFLDADTLIVQNCDELFEREELSAAPDVGWPDCFNSGVFVFVPSNDTYTRLITFAKERGSFDGGDQGLLNAFFSDWARGDISKHLPFLYNVTSAAFYSYIPALKHYGQDLKIIHFIGASKPWLQQFNWETRTVDAPEHLRQFLQTWWDLFVGQVHSQLDYTMESPVAVEAGSPETPPPDLPPEDTQHHYKPTVDAQSEFHWHHPETQPQETEMLSQQIDMSTIYDPWQHYRGTIPSRKSYSSLHSDLAGTQNEEEIRQNAWEYQNLHRAWSVSSYAQESSDQHTWQQPQLLNEHEYQDHHYSHQHQNPHHHEHSHHHWEEHSHQHNHNQHQHGNHVQSQGDWHSQSHHDPIGPNTEYSFQLHKNDQFNDHSTSSWQDHHSTFHSQHDNSHYKSHEENQYQHSHTSYHNDIQTHDAYSEKHSENRSDYNHAKHNHFNPLTIQRTQEQSYHLQLDHRRRKRVKRIHVCSKQMNGDISETESEEEFIIPRHPYDGFYLRHTMTIDPRGRKICTHEIPPTPSPSPPGSTIEDPFSRGGSPTLTEEFNTASECEDLDLDSGVAGNLARVTSGAGSYQREAIDELTRRQGWEAGNIDYLGADSFDNIWAKISQTLNQSRASPPKQPSPPKEAPVAPTPEAPATEAVVAPVATESPAVEPVVEIPVQSAPVASVPQTETPVAPVEVPAPQTEPTTQPEVPKTVEEVLAAESVSSSEASKVETKEKTEPTVPPTPPATPKSSEPSTPVTETPVEAEAAVAAQTVPAPEVPKAAESVAAAGAPAQPQVTPEKAQDTSAATAASTDSPPLANTPSKEEAPAAPAAKSEERRKPAEKLQLSAPAAGEALPTPDSEAEDAAALASSIIAGELSASVTSPSPTADIASPPPLEEKLLTVEKPELPTPPVSLAQIGVKAKGKPSTAAQIVSSISEKSEPASPPTAPSAEPASPAAASIESESPSAAPAAPAEPASPTATKAEPASHTDAPKKKVVKKGAKKDGASGGDATTPVPPPRKKEKKPKEK